MKKLLYVCGFIFFRFAGASELTTGQIYEKLKSLTILRESLAKTIEHKKIITEEDFKNVCQPVGKELKKWSDDNGLVSQQVSHKNRNENNAVKSNLKTTYDKFLKNSRLDQKTIYLTHDQAKSQLSVYRITVVQSCLACHGDQLSRPNFIKEKYKNDKAYNFKVGDLRGVYTVEKIKK
jgi:hypothetical protein